MQAGDEKLICNKNSDLIVCECGKRHGAVAVVYTGIHFVHNTQSTEVIMVTCFLRHAHRFDAHLISCPAAIFWGAQFSRKLARLYEYLYLGSVLYMNIHIGHDTKVFVTLREKKKAMKCPFPVPSPKLNPNYNTKSKPLHHKQLRKTMHTILPNVYRAYLV